MLLPILLSALTLTTALSTNNGTTPYTHLTFPPPLNWIPKVDVGSTLETFYKPDAQYNASGWARYVLAECESLAGTTCVGYSELTTGAYDTVAPYRIWWGIVYGQGPLLGVGDFRRDISEHDEVKDSFAFVTRGAGAGTSGSLTMTASSSSGSMMSTGTVPATTTTSPTGSSAMSAGGSSSTSASPSAATGQGDKIRPGRLVSSGFGLLICAGFI